jgi:hypothetical protein
MASSTGVTVCSLSEIPTCAASVLADRRNPKGGNYDSKKKK